MPFYDPTYAPAGSWFTPTGTRSWEAYNNLDPLTSQALAARPSSTTPVYVPGQGVVAMTEAQRQAFLASDAAYRNSQLRYRDSRNQVTDSQWDREFGETVAARQQRLTELRERIKEQRREFDLTHGLSVREADLNDRKFGLDERRFGLEQDTLGADLLKTGASMRGPLDYFQGAAYAQGVASSNLAPYVRALYTNGPQYGGGTATGGSPTPLTVGSLARTMTGEAVGPGAGAAGAPGTSGAGYLDTLGRTLTPEQQAYLAPIREAAEGGLANKGLGWWEDQTKSQRNAYISGSDFIGRDTEADLEYYRRSRPGQRRGNLA